MQDKREDYIVIVSSCPFPYGNASDNAIFTFMAGFQEHGCKGEVICLYPNVPEGIEVPPRGEYQGVKYCYLPGRTHRSKNKIRDKIDYTLLPSASLMCRLRKLRRKYTVTALFVTHVNEAYYRYTKICHLLGIKTVLVSCEYPEYLIDSSPERKKRFIELSSKTDKYIFETRTLDEYTRNALGQDIASYVIPATMPFDDILTCSRTETKPYIAYCGSINSEAKDGLKSIVRAYSLFHDQYPEYDLKFIGRVSREEYFEELKQLVEELGLRDSVSFAGGVEREAYVQYLTNATLMIVAKPRDSYYGGGLSSKVIEYLFSGNPVLMTDSDDYVYYLTHGENVFFVHDNNPETLSNALCELFASPERMKAIGAGGKEYAMEHFNYHKTTKGLLEFVLD